MTTPQRSNLTPALSGWRQGRGPSMLLMHGVGMRAEFWSNITPQLEQYFSLTIIDLPGHGESPPLANKTPSLGIYTDAVAQLLSASATPAIVVGHSMGALIALDLAVRYPQQVNGIAVLNGVYRRTAKALEAINARVAELANSPIAVKPNPTATLERWFGQTPQGIEARAAANCRDWLENINQSAYHAAYRAFAQADAPTDSQLQNITCPALFMTGAEEPNSTPAMSQSMGTQVPSSKCVIIDKARHMMSMTHGDEVSTTISQYFLGKTRHED